MIALTQFSYTSVKNILMASSVAGLVGLAPIAVDNRDDAPDVGTMGWWSRRNLTLPAVTKHDM
jgi:hypothetical protein